MSRPRVTVAELAEQLAVQGRLIEHLIANDRALKEALWQHEIQLRELHQRLGSAVLSEILEPPDRPER